MGVFDVDTMTFTTVPTTGDAASGAGKYDGAVVVGSKAGTPTQPTGYVSRLSLVCYVSRDQCLTV